MRIFANANYNFIRWRWHALIGSIVIIWGGVGWIWAHGGMKYGIDFTGGTAVEVSFPQQTDEDVVRKAVDPISKEAIVQKYGAPAKHELLIRLPMMEGVEQGTALDREALAVEAALKAANLQPHVEKTTVVGPVVGKELQRKGIYTTVTALGGILLYVWFRFRLTFAVGAIVAAFHDILITLVFLALFGYDMTLNIVAALLTITGYSVNDTIVVFDRVRENEKQMRREPLDQIVNKSVNQTLGRTIITSGATFVAVLALYLFGGEVLRGFAFTMLVGVLTGTYSTVFIAAAIAIILSRRRTAGPVTAAPARPSARPRRT